jgi:hypothetical protein
MCAWSRCNMRRLHVGEQCCPVLLSESHEGQALVCDRLLPYLPTKIVLVQVVSTKQGCCKCDNIAPCTINLRLAMTVQTCFVIKQRGSGRLCCCHCCRRELLKDPSLIGGLLLAQYAARS